MRQRHIAGFLALLIVLTGSATVMAGVRVIVQPWWPRALVVAPWLIPPPVVPVVVTPAPAPARDGYLDLDIKPGDAAVYVDDEYVGKARKFANSRRQVTLVSGSHTVSIRKDGFRPENFVIYIAADKTIELEVTMQSSRTDSPEPGPTYQIDLQKT